LIRAFVENSARNEEAVSPHFITSISDHGLLQIFTSAAQDAFIGLKDIDRRAEILRLTANQLLEFFGGTVSDLLAHANHRVAEPHGAYAQLAKLDAFRDPLKKKSTAFLMTIHFAGLWHIIDQQQIKPMIDYHRIRLLCRCGCIRILDHNLHRSLIEQTAVSETIEDLLRDAAANICRSLVDQTGLGMFECDNLLWAHARSCCRHHPICAGGVPEDSSFYNLISLPFTGRCDFQNWCPGAKNRNFRDIWEPAVETEHY
jgi:hypothetical protein